MASHDLPKRCPSLYPQVDQSSPDSQSPFASNPNPPPPSLSPSPEDLVDPNPNPAASLEETVITVTGAIVHLIDDERSVELACGEFSVVRIRQGDGVVVAVLARVGDEVQWPLMKEEAAVKLDDSHYFFSLWSPKDLGSRSDSEDGKQKAKTKKGKNQNKEEKPDYHILNYGLSFASKGQEKRLEDLDKVLQSYSAFSVQSVAAEGGCLDGMLVGEASPEDLKTPEKREEMEEKCAAYWTALAPNVEEYSGVAAKLIAVGSGQLIRGILWCGDVTVERLKWGNEVLKKRITCCEQREISPKTLRRIKRAKRVTKMTQKVAEAVLGGAVKVAEHFTSSVANTEAGKEFFSKLPGEILLASLDGFNKICDAIEVAGKSVMSTSSTVTTSLVTHKYGEQAGEATQEGLDAAGNAIWTAWTVFKIRKALKPKSTFKTTTLAKCAAEVAANEYKTKRDSKPN